MTDVVIEIIYDWCGYWNNISWWMNSFDRLYQPLEINMFV